MYWERRQPLPWGDVHLPEGWHLNRLRVPVPPVPRSGRARTDEILRRRALLPPDLVYDPAYAMNSELWDRWFELEHNHRRRLAFAATLPDNYAEEAAAEEAQEEDFEWSSTDGGADVKMEDQEEDQPEEDEDLKKAIQASELEELGRWPELAATLRASAEEAAAGPPRAGGASTRMATGTRGAGPASTRMATGTRGAGPASGVAVRPASLHHPRVRRG